MISALKPFRKLALRVLSSFDFSVDVKHHWLPGRSLSLHVYRHRGYWFYGKEREKKTIERFRAMVRPGQTVIEVGAHVGYLTTIFSSLVGPKGRVVAFEPGPNNLPYLRRNTKDFANVTVVEAAVGKAPGRARFYIEDLSGQNNTLVENYEGFARNRISAGSSATYRSIEVDVVSLDSYFRLGEKIDFIKIDTEGAETEVLAGGERTLVANRPALMVEMSGGAKAFDQLCALDYRVTKPNGDAVKSAEQVEFNQNLFFEPVSIRSFAHGSQTVH